MRFRIEVEQEDDGRWIAEVTGLPGVVAYGITQEEAEHKVQGLARRVMADRLENGEAPADLVDITLSRLTAGGRWNRLSSVSLVRGGCGGHRQHA